jgi:enoyl-CoA hydratase
VESKHLETIIYEKDGPIARIVMNTPEKANIQTAQQVWDFEDALTWANRDEEVKVLVIKSNGNGFCAGHAIVDRDQMADVYPPTGPTFERTWKLHNYDLFLWPPLHLTAIASAAGPSTDSSPTSPSRRTTRTSRCPCPRDSACPAPRP